MKKGLKQKISLILVMAMILGLSLPVSAKENRRVFDETIITEETAADQTVIEEESSTDNARSGYSLFGDMSASGDSVAGDTNRSGYRMLSLWNQYLYSMMNDDAAEADGSEEIIENLGTSDRGWTIKKPNGANATADDYTYVSGTITINNTGNTAGLVIYPTTTDEINLGFTWASDSQVPVKLSVDENFNGVGIINITINTEGKSISVDDSALVVEKRMGDLSEEYSYSYATSLQSGTYLVAKNSALTEDDVTIGNDIQGYPTLNFDSQVIGTATISSSDASLYTGINYYDAWRADGSGKSVIIFGEVSTVSSGDVSSVRSMKTLTFETLKSKVEAEITPGEDVTTEYSDSSSISGKLINADSDYCYEGAAFTARDPEGYSIVPYSITQINSPGSVSTGDAFTVTGLASSTKYWAGARRVLNNSDTRYQIQENGILYIPSYWIHSQESITTSAASNTYVIRAKNGDTETVEAPKSLRRVIFGTEEKESETAQLVLQKSGVTYTEKVTWSSSNPEAITVVPATGAIAIAAGAKDGASSTITAFYNGRAVVSCNVAVKEEGGDITICNPAGTEIGILEAITNTENTKFYINYPASMESGLTLSTPLIDKDIITVTAGQKTSTGTSVSVPYTIKTLTSQGDATVAIKAEYMSFSKTKYTKNLVLDVSVISQLLEFKNVNTGNNGYRYIKINSISANEPQVLAPNSWGGKAYSFASNNANIADVHPTSGVITPKSVGVAKFTGTLEGTTMESRDLYVVDPTPNVVAPTYITWDKPFSVTATFPGDYYMASGISVTANISGVGDIHDITTSKLDNGKLTVTLSKGTLSDAALKAKTMDLAFVVTAKSDITGEFGIFCQQITKTVNIGGRVDVLGGGFTLEGLEAEYPYTGAPIKPAFAVVDNATGMTLANGTDYSVSFSNNTKIGVATIKVKGKGNYNKSNAEANFKIVNPKEGMDEADLADLKGAKITAVSPKAFDYDGEAHFPETITLKLKGRSEVTYTGTDGENYVDAEGNALPAAVSFSGNVNKGTATVLLSGKNTANGKATTVKKTFKINAVDLKAATTEDLTVTVAEETVAWEVKGAQPEVKVEYKGKELLAGQDYKVTYKNNKKVGTASVTIAGKGNYAKTRKDAASFAIEAFDLTGADIIATTAAAGVKVTKVKVTILDKAGNAIPAGKLAVTVEGAAGAKLAAGETVTVKASAKGAELKESCTEEVTVQAGDLSKANIKVNVKKTYTGEEIELTEDDMKLVTVTVAGATLVYGEDFEIAGYSNNIKKGSMVVTVVGKGEKYSGSKTFKVKIEPKPIGAGK